MAKQTNVIRVDEDVQYLAALKPVNDLRAKQTLVKAIIDRLQADIQPAAFRDAVDAIVSGVDPVLAAAALDNTRALTAARESLALITHAIARAQGIAEREQAAAQQRFVDRVRPQYREVATRFINALIQFGLAQQDMIEFDEQCIANGLPDFPGFVEGPKFAQRLDHPAAEVGFFATFLVSAVAAGIIDAGALPQQWAAAWPLLMQIKKFGVDGLPEPERTALVSMRGRAGSATSRGGLFRRAAY